MAGAAVSRALALAALILAVVVVAVVVLGGGARYRIQAHFADAGQLVKGDLVEVGGRNVGKVTALRLTPDGMADVELTLDDQSVVPLHEGTLAAIRTVGLSAIANRFVELSPGPPSAPKIADGGVLAETQTRGIVDLDVLLDAVDPAVRAHLRTIVHQAAAAFAAPSDRQANAAIRFLDPALAQVDALGGQLVADQRALRRLVATGALATHAIASRQADLGAGLDGAAATLDQIAGQRGALADALDRAPATLGQATATLRDLRATLPAVDPALSGLRPAVAPLGRLLRHLGPVARDAQPAVREIRKLLPQAVAVLRRMPALDRQASPALASTTVALRGLLPIVAGLRTYGPDLVGGLFNGFGGAAGGYFDANGHYLRISLEGAPSSFPGILSPTPGAPGPGAGYRTGLVARCPGGAEEPAPDGSNPWVPDKRLCDPAQDHK